MRKKIAALLLATLSLAACRKGPHVTVIHVQTSAFACEFSDSYLAMDRTVAICQTAQECSKICDDLAAGKPPAKN